MSVNDTEILCNFPKEQSEMFNFSVICNGLSSEPLNLLSSSKVATSLFVESFANAIDGSISCANVVGSHLHLIRHAYLCDQSVDVSRNNVSQSLNLCIQGSHFFCRLQLFDEAGSVIFSALVNSSSTGVLNISPSVFVSQSWIAVTITAYNLKYSTCSLSGLQQSFSSKSDTLVVSHYLTESQHTLEIRCIDVSSISQNVSFAVFPRNFVYSIAPVVHSSGSSAIFTLFGKNFNVTPKACCRIGDEYVFVQVHQQHEAFCELHIPGHLHGNASLDIYHMCGERHFLSFAIRLNTPSSAFLHRPYLELLVTHCYSVVQRCWSAL